MHHSLEEIETGIINAIRQPFTLGLDNSWIQSKGLIAQKATEETLTATWRYIAPEHTKLAFALSSTPHGQAIQTIADIGIKYQAAQNAIADTPELDAAAIQFHWMLERAGAAQNALQTIIETRQAIKNSIPDMDQVNKVGHKAATLLGNSERFMYELAKTQRQTRINGITDKSEIIARAICLTIEYPNERASKDFIKGFNSIKTPRRIKIPGTNAISRNYRPLEENLIKIREAYADILDALKICAPDQADDLLAHIITGTDKTHSFLLDADFENLKKMAERKLTNAQNKIGQAVSIQDAVFEDHVLDGLIKYATISPQKARLAHIFRKAGQGVFNPEIMLKGSGIKIKAADNPMINTELLEALENAFFDPESDLEHIAWKMRSLNQKSWSTHVNNQRQSIEQYLKTIEANPNRDTLAKQKIEQACRALFVSAKNIQARHAQLNKILYTLTPSPSTTQTPTASAAPETQSTNDPWALSAEDLNSMTGGGAQNVDWNRDTSGIIRSDQMTTTNTDDSEWYWREP